MNHLSQITCRLLATLIVSSTILTCSQNKAFSQGTYTLQANQCALWDPSHVALPLNTGTSGQTWQIGATDKGYFGPNAADIFDSFIILTYKNNGHIGYTTPLIGESVSVTGKGNVVLLADVDPGDNRLGINTWSYSPSSSFLFQPLPALTCVTLHEGTGEMVRALETQSQVKTVNVSASGAAFFGPKSTDFFDQVLVAYIKKDGHMGYSTVSIGGHSKVITGRDMRFFLMDGGIGGYADRADNRGSVSITVSSTVGSTSTAPTVDGVLTGDAGWAATTPWTLSLTNGNGLTLNENLYLTHDANFLYVAVTGAYKASFDSYMELRVSGRKDDLLQGSSSTPFLVAQAARASISGFGGYTDFWALLSASLQVQCSPSSGYASASAGSSSARYEFAIPLSDLGITGNPTGAVIKLNLLNGTVGTVAGNLVLPGTDRNSPSTWLHLVLG